MSKLILLPHPSSEAQTYLHTLAKEVFKDLFPAGTELSKTGTMLMYENKEPWEGLCLYLSTIENPDEKPSPKDFLFVQDIPDLEDATINKVTKALSDYAKQAFVGAPAGWSTVVKNIGQVIPMMSATRITVVRQVLTPDRGFFVLSVIREHKTYYERLKFVFR